MALGTSSQERIRPVTGTHVVRVQHEGIVTVDQPGGRIQMLCNDPDGNTLEFQPTTV
jgi:hypothetical protein